MADDWVGDAAKRLKAAEAAADRTHGEEDEAVRQRQIRSRFPEIWNPLVGDLKRTIEDFNAKMGSQYIYAESQADKFSARWVKGSRSGDHISVWKKEEGEDTTLVLWGDGQEGVDVEVDDAAGTLYFQSQLGRQTPEQLAREILEPFLT